MATPTKARRAASRQRALKTRRRTTFNKEVARHIRAFEERIRRSKVTWPSGYYYDKPVEFFEEVLGITLWGKQREIVEAVAANTRVACRSGRKVGKSKIAAGLALWFYCTRQDAQVLILAATSRQVQKIVWREVRMCVERANPATPIDGQLNLMAANGLISDFREIYGFTATDREAAAGTSGRNIFYIVDEGSGVKREIFDTIEGNMMGGGCKLFVISNPTKTEGYFFEIFHTKEARAVDGNGKTTDWVLFTVSSTENPNCVEGRIVIPGLAVREEIEKHRRTWGEDSPDYIIHILGRHALAEERRAFSVALVTEARDRNEDLELDGPLVAGLDPAGDTTIGDLSALSIRRGLKQLDLESRSGQKPEQLADWVIEWLDAHRNHPRESASVVYDVGGEVGAKTLTALREAQKRGRYRLYPVRSSDNAVRYTSITKRRSAELVWNFREVLKAGGGIVDDDELYDEIRAWEFFLERHDSELYKVNKNEVRKVLGRSPDKFDATALSFWDPIAVEETLTTAPRDDEHQPAPTGDRRGRNYAAQPMLNAFDPRARRV